MPKRGRDLPALAVPAKRRQVRTAPLGRNAVPATRKDPARIEVDAQGNKATEFRDENLEPSSREGSSDEADISGMSSLADIDTWLESKIPLEDKDGRLYHPKTVRMPTSLSTRPLSWVLRDNKKTLQFRRITAPLTYIDNLVDRAENKKHAFIAAYKRCEVGKSVSTSTINEQFMYKLPIAPASAYNIASASTPSPKAVLDQDQEGRKHTAKAETVANQDAISNTQNVARAKGKRLSPETTTPSPGSMTQFQLDSYPPQFTIPVAENEGQFDTSAMSQLEFEIDPCGLTYPGAYGFYASLMPGGSIPTEIVNGTVNSTGFVTAQDVGGIYLPTTSRSSQVFDSTFVPAGSMEK